MANTSPGNRRWLVVLIVLAVIVVALALSFGGHHQKAPDNTKGSPSSHVVQTLVA